MKFFFGGETRLETILHTPGDVSAAGRFSVAEVRTILSESKTYGLKGARDLRLLGCPETIFLNLLERRAKKLGLSAPATTSMSDADRRAAVAKLGAQVAKDKADRDLLVEIYNPKF
jgi:hypothetical protein